MNTMCICQPGFLNASGTCSTCPTGATSTDGNFSSSTAGFWSNSKVFPPCPLGTGSCAGNVACLATFTGELCALCKPGNARQENSCIDCMASIWSLPMPCALIACFAMGELFLVIRYLTFWRRKQPDAGTTGSSARGWILQAQIQRACDCKTFAHSGPSSRS